MMAPTEQDEVGQVGAAAANPLLDVMRFQAMPTAASRVTAATIAEQECLELPFADDPMRAAEVEYGAPSCRVFGHHRRPDPSATQQAFDDRTRQSGTTRDPARSERGESSAAAGVSSTARLLSSTCTMMAARSSPRNNRGGFALSLIAARAISAIRASASAGDSSSARATAASAVATIAPDSGSSRADICHCPDEFQPCRT
jgi:hypothetical protein